MCSDVSPPTSAVKGKVNYDAHLLKAEFVPQNMLYPNSKYTIVVMGHAVTTSRSAYGMNIKSAVFQFETCNPGPINIGMKLKRQAPEEVSEN